MNPYSVGTYFLTMNITMISTTAVGMEFETKTRMKVLTPSRGYTLIITVFIMAVAREEGGESFFAFDRNEVTVWQRNLVCSRLMVLTIPRAKRMRLGD